MRRGAATTLVLDAKYSLASDASAHANHHYQLLSYAIRHGIKDVALVYVRDPSLPTRPTDIVADGQVSHTQGLHQVLIHLVHQIGHPLRASTTDGF